MMTTARDVLNQLKWGDDQGLEGVEIYYVHRGAPGDFKVLKGEEIINLGRSFISHARGDIPYHRVFKITRGEDVFLDRD